jgi:hypothetical protein
MNKNLYNNIAVLPDTLIKHLQDCFSSLSADSSIEGFKRNQELRTKKSATYQQIKRIKNWFDGYNGNKEDAPFILNGGDRMKNWCDEVLKVWRANQEGVKNIKSKTGMQNAYYKEHDKNGINLNQTDLLKNNTKVQNDLNEEITKINQMIKKIL